jgi:hypothetical protein
MIKPRRIKMSKLYSISFLVILLSLTLSFCTPKNKDVNKMTEDTKSESDSSAIEFIRIESAPVNPNRENLVIKDENKWKELWSKRSDVVPQGEIQIPENAKVDFSKDMVIAVFMGRKPNGCYGTKITSIIKKSSEIVVHIQETTPDKGMMCIQVITYPSFVVKIPKSELPVKFEYIQGKILGSEGRKE